MKKILKVLIPLAIASTAIILIYRYNVTDTAKDFNTLHLSGNIETTTVELSFKLPGRLDQRLVAEGETIHTQQLIAQLDSNELLQEVALRQTEVGINSAAVAELLAGSRPEEIARAQANTQQAEARLKELLAGTRREEINVANAALAKAKAEVERWQAEYQRHQALYQSGDIPAQQYDLTKTAYETAKSQQQSAEAQLNLLKEGARAEQIEQARAALTATKEQLALIEHGPRKETIAQAQARLQQSKELLGIAQTHLSYSQLFSPLTGIVLSQHVEPGEYVTVGTPIVTIGDLSKVWLRAYINETDLARVKVGQTVKITTDSYKDKAYTGYVSFIAEQAEFTPKNIQTTKERVKLVYRIKIDIQNPNLELKPGMPADAQIALQ